MATKEDLYGAFVDYYGNLPFKKLKQEQGYAIYAHSVGSGLSENRYIFIVVPQGIRPLPETVNLNSVDWLSFQTRSTLDHHPNIPNSQLLLTEQRKNALPDLINCVERTKEQSRYFTNELPINITLVHDRKKNNTLQYPDKCKLYQALETYNCVIELL